jgi:hypothetical protein
MQIHELHQLARQLVMDMNPLEARRWPSSQYTAGWPAWACRDYELALRVVKTAAGIAPERIAPITIKNHIKRSAFVDVKKTAKNVSVVVRTLEGVEAKQRINATRQAIRRDMHKGKRVLLYGSKAIYKVVHVTEYYVKAVQIHPYSAFSVVKFWLLDLSLDPSGLHWNTNSKRHIATPAIKGFVTWPYWLQVLAQTWQRQNHRMTHPQKNYFSARFWLGHYDSNRTPAEALRQGRVVKQPER